MFELLLPCISILIASLLAFQACGFVGGMVRRSTIAKSIARGHTRQKTEELSESLAAAAELRAARIRPTKSMRQLMVAGIVNESVDSKSYYLSDPAGDLLPSFRAGQHLLVQRVAWGNDARAEQSKQTLHSSQSAADRPALSRCYSLSGVATPTLSSVARGLGHWRITVKKQPGGNSSSSLSHVLHEEVREGDLLTVSEPRGQFVLVDSDWEHPIVLFAAGIGVTPIVSILETLLAQECPQQIIVVYQVRDLAHAAFHERLVELAARSPWVELKIYCSQLTPTRSIPRPFYAGKINAACIEFVAQYKDAHAYLCGPTEWMSWVTESLLAVGFADDQVHFESFGAATPKPDRAGESDSNQTMRQTTTGTNVVATVQYNKTNVSVEVTDSAANLLDISRQAGVAVDAGCRSGVCGACVARLVAGQTEYDTEPTCDLDAGEIALCLSRPVGEVQLSL
jgi:ferredoxin-NADP reductase